MSANVPAFSQENPCVLSCHGQINCKSSHSAGALSVSIETESALGPFLSQRSAAPGMAAAVRVLGQDGYNDPRYAVSRPPMVTAAHNRQLAVTNLTPRDDTVPAASQPATSRFMVFWKYDITTMAMTTSVSLISNMPSARYCA